MRKNFISILFIFLITNQCVNSFSINTNNDDDEISRVADDSNDADDVAEDRPRIVRRAQFAKKFKPFDTQQGYSIDINIDSYRSTRYCNAHEMCKFRYKQYFECVCPTFTMCMGFGSLFDARCSKNLMPYVWMQSINMPQQPQSQQQQQPQNVMN